MKIIIVTGMPGSGKEEFLNVARSMDIPFLRMGDLVREHYELNGCAEKGVRIGEFASLEREINGNGIWAQRAIEKMSGDIYLVDGCRSNNEVQEYKAISPDVIIVAIHASRETRYRRLVARGREDAPLNIDDFDSRDNREMGWGIGNTISLADIIIDNSSTLEDFQQRAREVLESLR